MSNRKFLIKIPLFLITVIALQLCFITSYRVDGVSMSPNLETNDRMFVMKSLYKINRFDIVVFKKNNNIYVKRIIGLPNETVEFLDSSLYINNKVMKPKCYSVLGNTEDFKWHTLENKYVVLGDNRVNSVDSRQFGVISKSEIIGKVSMVYYPITKWTIFNFIEEVKY